MQDKVMIQTQSRNAKMNTHTQKHTHTYGQLRLDALLPFHGGAIKIGKLNYLNSLENIEGFVLQCSQ